MSQTRAAAGSGWSCRSLSWCSDRARTPPERSDITTPAAQKHTHTQAKKKKGLQNEFVQVMHHLRKHSDPPESLQDMSKTVLEWTSQRPDLNLTEHLRRWRRQSRDAFPSSLEKFKRICWKENCPNPGVQILQTLSQKDLKLQLLLANQCCLCTAQWSGDFLTFKKIKYFNFVYYRL